MEFLGTFDGGITIELDRGEEVTEHYTRLAHASLKERGGRMCRPFRTMPNLTDRSIIVREILKGSGFC